ncbi:MAG: PEP-CTERM sorting domain-containing protein [Nitrospira sp.]
MQRPIVRWLTIAVILTWNVGNDPFAVAVPISYNTGSQMVTGRIDTPLYTDQGQTYGPFGSNYGYTQIFDGATVVRHVELNFTFDQNFTTAQQQMFRSTAESGVEGIWNNRAVITDTMTQRSFPLLVDVTTTGPVFDQNTFVNSGPGRSNTSIWYAGSVTAGVMAHEVGHYLGLYDEYIGGAVDRYPNPTLSTALMGTGANDENPQMLSRYYQGYLDFMTGLNPGHQFTIATAPEPSTLLMLLSGMIGILFFRRQRSLHSQERSAPNELGRN